MLADAGTLDLGTGVYSFGEAARLIRRGQGGASPRQLRYWISTGLTPRGSHPSLLSFPDLVSLELVSRFRYQGVSLQRVRKFEERLREEFPELDRPFATEIFFTDGVSIWAQFGDAESRLALEIVGRRKDHLCWTDAIQTFAHEVKYRGGFAAAWTLGEYVEVNPEIQFGAPVVRGTRLLVSTVEANLRVGTPKQVAGWYGLTLAEVNGVRDYLAATG